MIQFRVLSGKKAGTELVARRFPVRIGRSRTADLTLEEEGVWEQHLVVRFAPGVGVVLRTEGEALACVNGDLVHEAVLRNGDQIEVGSARLQFWLAATRQRGLLFRELATSALVGAVVLAEVALLYWLLRA